MVIKIALVLLLIISLYFLASAAYLMLREPEGSKRMAKALIWRLAAGLILFALLIAGYYLGWIQPHPLALPVQPAA